MVELMDLIYVITYRCNLRCSYCLVKKQNLSISKKIINSSVQLISSKIRKVRIFGGEPLLEFKLLQYLIKKIRAKNKYLPIYITTNSILLDEKKISWLKRNRLQLSISLDGNEFTQLKNRKGLNSFKKIIWNLPKLSPQTIYNLVIAPNTAKYFFYNFRYLVNLGITRFNILPAYYNNWSSRQINNLENNFALVYNYIKKNSLQNKLYLQNLDNFTELTLFNKALVIDCDGKIYNTTAVLTEKIRLAKKLFQIGDFKKNQTQISNRKVVQKQFDELVGKKDMRINKRLNMILSNFIYKYKKLI